MIEPNMALAALLARIGGNLPDDIYLRIRYFLIMKRRMHIKNPQTYNAKINWLKLYNKNPLYTLLVDKASVKGYVKNIIGEEYIIPTLGVWDSFEEIDFDRLPNKFVLKSTNGGGGTGVVICRDKSKFNKESARKQLASSLAADWKIGREWVYRDVPPRYIAEEIIENRDGSELVDYKFHCFDGEPKLLFLASDRYLGENTLKFDWYDMDLNHLPFKSKGYENSNKEIPFFPEFDLMKEIARKLSEGMPYVRVDLYLVNRKIYFGELTFFHDAGFVALEPEEWEYKLGSWIKLNGIKN